MRIFQRFIGGLGLAVLALATLVESVAVFMSPRANRFLVLLPLSGVLLGAIAGVGLRKAKAPLVRQHRELLVGLISSVCVITCAIIFVLTFVQHRLSTAEGGAAGVAVAAVVLGLAATEGS